MPLAVSSPQAPERTGDVSEYATSIRIKCSKKLKRELAALALEWDAEKAGKFDMSGVIRTLVRREVKRRKRKREREAALGKT